MRIVQLLPELISGGVERGTIEMSRALVESGHDSIVISNGGPMVDELSAHGATHIQMPVHRKALSSLGQIGPLRRLFQEHQVDLVHARSRVPAWLSYLAWRKMPADSRPRFMTTFHGYHSVSKYSEICLLYTSPSPRDGATSRMPSSA